jgi:predicted glutamine amidotransferase
MCELFGMSFNQPVVSNFSFRGFIRRGNDNPHGWGMALYPDQAKSVQIIKEKYNADKSEMAAFINGYPKLRSRIYLSHVRRKSRGDASYPNTHPFSRELNGRDYCFAHNGTLRVGFEQNLPLGRFKPTGETDSEYAFCYLMGFIEQHIQEWDIKAFQTLHEVLRNINKEGNFNCLLSDGEYLFCYHDQSEYNGLCYTQRQAPFSNVRLLDEDYEIDLEYEKSPSQKGAIVATMALTNEPWVKFGGGELMVIKDGNIIFSSSADLKTTQVQVLKYIRMGFHRVSIVEIQMKLNLNESCVKECIKELSNAGYIKQDSRDTVEALHDEATYYTVPAKRTEIEKIIAVG